MSQCVMQQTESTCLSLVTGFEMRFADLISVFCLWRPVIYWHILGHGLRVLAGAAGKMLGTKSANMYEAL